MSIFSLETIILSDNKLTSISFDETPPTGTTKYFPKLKSVTINHNSIAEVKINSTLVTLSEFPFLDYSFVQGPVIQSIRSTR